MGVCLDVSNNAPITAAEVKAAGCSVLLCKATEGTGFKDSTLATHRQIAKDLGIPFGSYVFLHPDSKGSEAQFYLDYAQPRKGDVQPIIDAEVTSMGTQELADRTLACARALQAAGYRPILYASSSIWEELILWRPALKGLHVWEAQYPGRFARWFPKLAKLRLRLRHGVTVVLWQFSDSFQVGPKKFDASFILAPINKLLI
jgi:GH25 family lysozyme M1 (1,4-beta-N-acetylmuramidase)